MQAQIQTSSKLLEANLNDDNISVYYSKAISRYQRHKKDNQNSGSTQTEFHSPEPKVETEEPKKQGHAVFGRPKEIEKEEINTKIEPLKISVTDKHNRASSLVVSSEIMGEITSKILT